ncbi:MAG: S9 family peptidase [Dysgonamonadaceae bacterium]|nr:S9 family peptidase [Dysgonamonadaceae bacterium]MDD3900932.1 S9 family peptidase [Dysgonamonadaceae bacterium]
MKQQNVMLLCMVLVALISCDNTKNVSKMLNQNDFPATPVADIRPDSFENFGHKRVDNYFWMRDKNNPRVIEYLKAENEYTDTVMTSTKGLQQSLYDEIIGRIKEDDESYPTFKNGYYYYNRTEKGKQYSTYCRKKGSLNAPEEIIFDVNKMAEGKQAFIFIDYIISPDNNKVAFLYNETGSYAEFIMKVKDLNTGQIIGFTVEGAASAAWANDNKTLFYSTIDNTLRSNRIFRQQLFEDKNTLIYEEKDPKFSVYVSNDKRNEYVFISSSSSTTSEEQFISADLPLSPFKMFIPRIQDTDYSVYPHKDMFFVHYKDKENLNGKIYTTPLTGYEDKKSWKEFLPHDNSVRIESLDVLDKYVTLELRKNGLNEIHLKSINSEDNKVISFPEPVYNVSLIGNPEYDSLSIRYSYTSLNRPNTLYSFDITTGNSTVLKVQEIPSGFDPDKYVVERLWATTDDGLQVPMAIVYKKGLKKDGSNPALLYSYGSYGMSSDAYFRSSMYSLIDRGFVFGIAQIRGGSDLGEQWYEDGKLLKKKNTFNDFIACTEKLINEGYTSSQKLAAMGGSAGGLLMGAIANMRPDLYQTIVAQVPFVDVVNTMLDKTLPLTTGEYEEWGNPEEEEYFNYILSYSPYDNIKQKNYPNMLITGGLNDSQVLFHEPTKYTAKLRANKTDNNLLLLHMNMDSGHGGATGRYDGIKDVAFEFAFILNRVGIEK